MSGIKKGKFSNYQFGKIMFQSPHSGMKTNRTSTQLGSNIYQISQLDSFRENNSKINPDCIEKIQTARQMYEQTEKNYNNRIKGELYFLNYRQNPFIPTENKDHLNLTEQPNNNKGSQNINQIKIQQFYQKGRTIIQALNKLHSRELNTSIDCKLNSKKIEKLPKYDFSLEKGQTKKNLTPKAKDSGEVLKWNVKKTQYKQKQKIVDNPLADLDRIVKMDDDNFFERQVTNKQTNIFSILYFKKGEGSIKSRLDMLINKKFCFESVVKVNNSSVLFNIDDHISPVFRVKSIDVKNKQNRVLYDQKMILDIEKIQLKDMIKVANGNLKSEELAAFLRDMKILNNQGKQNEQQFYIINKENQRNVSVLNQEIQQFSYINLDPFSKRQQWQLQFNQKCKKQIKQVLDSEKECDCKGIYDEKLRKKLKEEKNKILKNQIGYSHVYQRAGIKKNQITMKTLGKDRVQNIRTKGLVSTLNINRIYETVWKSRSKSKNNTQRFH